MSSHVTSRIPQMSSHPAPWHLGTCHEGDLYAKHTQNMLPTEITTLYLSTHRLSACLPAGLPADLSASLGNAPSLDRTSMHVRYISVRMTASRRVHNEPVPVDQGTQSPTPFCWTSPTSKHPVLSRLSIEKISYPDATPGALPGQAT